MNYEFRMESPRVQSLAAQVGTAIHNSWLIIHNFSHSSILTSSPSEKVATLTCAASAPATSWNAFP